MQNRLWVDDKRIVAYLTSPSQAVESPIPAVSSSEVINILRVRKNRTLVNYWLPPGMANPISTWPDLCSTHSSEKIVAAIRMAVQELTIFLMQEYSQPGKQSKALGFLKSVLFNQPEIWIALLRLPSFEHIHDKDKILEILAWAVMACEASKRDKSYPTFTQAKLFVLSALITAENSLFFLKLTLELQYIYPGLMRYQIPYERSPHLQSANLLTLNILAALRCLDFQPTPDHQQQCVAAVKETIKLQGGFPSYLLDTLIVCKESVDCYHPLLAELCKIESLETSLLRGLMDASYQSFYKKSLVYKFINDFLLEHPYWQPDFFDIKKLSFFVSSNQADRCFAMLEKLNIQQTVDAAKLIDVLYNELFYHLSAEIFGIKQRVIVQDILTYLLNKTTWSTENKLQIFNRFLSLSYSKSLSDKSLDGLAELKQSIEKFMQSLEGNKEKIFEKTIDLLLNTVWFNCYRMLALTYVIEWYVDKVDMVLDFNHSDEQRRHKYEVFFVRKYSPSKESLYNKLVSIILNGADAYLNGNSIFNRNYFFQAIHALLRFICRDVTFQGKNLLIDELISNLSVPFGTYLKLGNNVILVDASRVDVVCMLLDHISSFISKDFCNKCLLEAGWDKHLNSASSRIEQPVTSSASNAPSSQGTKRRASELSEFVSSSDLSSEDEEMKRVETPRACYAEFFRNPSDAEKVFNLSLLDEKENLSAGL